MSPLNNALEGSVPYQPGMENITRARKPDLSVLHQYTRPAPAMPVEEAFGPIWANWIGSIAENAGCAVDYPAGTILACVGALIGNSRWAAPFGGWVEPPTQNIGLIGQPSDGKSSSVKMIMRLPQDIENEALTDHEYAQRRYETEKFAARLKLEAWEKKAAEADADGLPIPVKPEDAIEPDPPQRPRITVGDTTLEALCLIHQSNPRGLLLYRDELAGFLSSFGRYNSGGDREFWLEAYGGGVYKQDRKGNASTILIPNLSIGVLGTIQPDKLHNLLLHGSDDGLASRFLWLWPQRMPPVLPLNDVDWSWGGSAFSRLHTLDMRVDEFGNNSPFLLPFSEPAITTFQAWRLQHFEKSNDASGMLASALGKMPGKVCRLALILEHLSWCSEPNKSPPAEISATSVGKAQDLLDSYFMPVTEMVYGDAALPEEDRLASSLAKYITKHKPKTINASKIRTEARIPGLRKAAKVKMAIDGLEEAQWIWPSGARDGDTIGRKKSDYTVNPSLWELLE